MAGAAACAGAMLALARRGEAAPAIAVLALAENAISGSAYRPSDVLRHADGTTIEIIDTDAEGRLVLADALGWVVRLGVSGIVDLATLTGSVVTALGHERAGLFSNDDALAARVAAAGEAVGERVWRLPIDASHLAALESEIADVRHCSPERGQPDACQAAAFLRHFVGATPWVHLDIAGVEGHAEAKCRTCCGGDGIWRAAAGRAGGRMSVEVGFYHLTRTGPEEALPKLLGRTLEARQRAVVQCAPARVAVLDEALWLCTDPDWLPHAATGDASVQPIWITAADEAPNGARFLFLLDGVAATLDRYERVFDLFDGKNEEALAAARTRWRAAKAAGHSLTYWQQGAKGWEKR